MTSGPGRWRQAGKPFTEQLEHKLSESTAFLLLVGKRGVDRWVRAEVDVALKTVR
nr:hypothetical protein [Archangium sp.]